MTVASSICRLSLKADFEKAAEDAKTLPDKTTNDDKLQLYGLYKQATTGDVTGCEFYTILSIILERIKPNSAENLSSPKAEKVLLQLVQACLIQREKPNMMPGKRLKVMVSSGLGCRSFDVVLIHIFWLLWHSNFL